MMHHNLFRQIVSGIVLLAFCFTSLVDPHYVYAAPSTVSLPPVGTLLNTTADFTPVIVRGMSLYPDNPMKFDFIMDTGTAGSLNDKNIRDEADKMIKYFLSSLTIPDNDQWVNLSPYESGRIVEDRFGQTQMGRDLLAQDYILKQLMASLSNPEDELGKTFWDRVYSKAAATYGSMDIPLDTFNKVWIMPDEASVYENGQSVFIVKRHLKVMLEEDYLALQHNVIARSPKDDEAILNLSEIATPDKTGLAMTDTKQIIKDILLPELEREVNEGRHFAPLRQIYNAMILSTWYKMRLKQSILGQRYADQGAISGIDDVARPEINQIYNQYLEAFKAGVYDVIKEDYDPATQSIIPRKYFSGGILKGLGMTTGVNQAMLKILTEDQVNFAELAQVKGEAVVVEFGLTGSEAEAQELADAAMMGTDSQTRLSLKAIATALGGVLVGVLAFFAVFFHLRNNAGQDGIRADVSQSYMSKKYLQDEGVDTTQFKPNSTYLIGSEQGFEKGYAIINIDAAGQPKIFQVRGAVAQFVPPGEKIANFHRGRFHEVLDSVMVMAPDLKEEGIDLIKIYIPPSGLVGPDTTLVPELLIKLYREFGIATSPLWWAGQLMLNTDNPNRKEFVFSRTVNDDGLALKPENLEFLKKKTIGFAHIINKIRKVEPGAIPFVIWGNEPGNHVLATTNRFGGGIDANINLFLLPYLELQNELIKIYKEETDSTHPVVLGYGRFDPDDSEIFQFLEFLHRHKKEKTLYIDAVGTTFYPWSFRGRTPEDLETVKANFDRLADQFHELGIPFLLAETGQTVSFTIGKENIDNPSDSLLQAGEQVQDDFYREMLAHFSKYMLGSRSDKENIFLGYIAFELAPEFEKDLDPKEGGIHFTETGLSLNRWNSKTGRYEKRSKVLETIGKQNSKMEVFLASPEEDKYKEIPKDTTRLKYLFTQNITNIVKQQTTAKNDMMREIDYEIRLEHNRKGKQLQHDLDEGKTIVVLREGTYKPYTKEDFFRRYFAGEDLGDIIMVVQRSGPKDVRRYFLDRFVEHSFMVDYETGVLWSVDERGNTVKKIGYTIYPNGKDSKGKPVQDSIKSDFYGEVHTYKFVHAEMRRFDSDSYQGSFGYDDLGANNIEWHYAPEQLKNGKVVDGRVIIGYPGEATRYWTYFNVEYTRDADGMLKPKYIFLNAEGEPLERKNLVLSEKNTAGLAVADSRGIDIGDIDPKLLTGMVEGRSLMVAKLTYHDKNNHKGVADLYIVDPISNKVPGQLKGMPEDDHVYQVTWLAPVKDGGKEQRTFLSVVQGNAFRLALLKSQGAPDTLVEARYENYEDLLNNDPILQKMPAFQAHKDAIKRTLEQSFQRLSEEMSQDPAKGLAYKIARYKVITPEGKTSYAYFAEKDDILGRAIMTFVDYPLSNIVVNTDWFEKDLVANSKKFTHYGLIVSKETEKYKPYSRENVLSVNGLRTKHIKGNRILNGQEEFYRTKTYFEINGKKALVREEFSGTRDPVGREVDNETGGVVAFSYAGESLEEILKLPLNVAAGIMAVDTVLGQNIREMKFHEWSQAAGTAEYTTVMDRMDGIKVMPEAGVTSKDKMVINLRNDVKYYETRLNDRIVREYFFDDFLVFVNVVDKKSGEETRYAEVEYWQDVDQEGHLIEVYSLKVIADANSEVLKEVLINGPEVVVKIDGIRQFQYNRFKELGNRFVGEFNPVESTSNSLPGQLIGVLVEGVDGLISENTDLSYQQLAEQKKWPQLIQRVMNNGHKFEFKIPNPVEKKYVDETGKGILGTLTFIALTLGSLLLFLVSGGKIYQVIAESQRNRIPKGFERRDSGKKVDRAQLASKKVVSNLTVNDYRTIGFTYAQSQYLMYATSREGKFRNYDDFLKRVTMQDIRQASQDYLDKVFKEVARWDQKVQNMRSASQSEDDIKRQMTEALTKLGLDGQQAKTIWAEYSNYGAFKNGNDFLTRVKRVNLKDVDILSEDKSVAKRAINRLEKAKAKMREIEDKYNGYKYNNDDVFDQTAVGSLQQAASQGKNQFWDAFINIYGVNEDDRTAAESFRQMVLRFLPQERIEQLMRDEYAKSLIGTTSQHQAAKILLRRLYEIMRDEPAFETALRQRIDGLFSNQKSLLKDTFIKNTIKARLLPDMLSFHQFDVKSDFLIYSWDDLRRAPPQGGQHVSDLVSVEKLYFFHVVFQRSLYGLAGQGRAEEWLWLKYIEPLLRDGQFTQAKMDIISKRLQLFVQVFQHLIRQETQKQDDSLENRRDPNGNIAFLIQVIGMDQYNEAFRYLTGIKDSSLGDDDWTIAVDDIIRRANSDNPEAQDLMFWGITEFQAESIMIAGRDGGFKNRDHFLRHMESVLSGSDFQDMMTRLGADAWRVSEKIKQRTAQVRQNFLDQIDFSEADINSSSYEREAVVIRLANQIAPALKEYVNVMQKETETVIAKKRFAYFQIRTWFMSRLLKDARWRQRLLSSGEESGSLRERGRRFANWAIPVATAAIFTSLIWSSVGAAFAAMTIPSSFIISAPLLLLIGSVPAAAVLILVIAWALNKRLVGSIKNVKAQEQKLSDMIKDGQHSAQDIQEFQKKINLAKVIKRYGRNIMIGSWAPVVAVLVFALIISNPYLAALLGATWSTAVTVPFWGAVVSMLLPTFLFISTWYLASYAMNFIVAAYAIRDNMKENNLYEIYRLHRPDQIVDRLNRLFTDKTPAFRIKYELRGQERLRAFLDLFDEMSLKDDNYYYIADYEINDAKARSVKDAIQGLTWANDSETRTLRDVLIQILNHLSTEDSQERAKLEKALKAVLTHIVKEQLDGDIESQVLDPKSKKIHGHKEQGKLRLLEYVRQNYRTDKPLEPLNKDMLLPTTLIIQAAVEDIFFGDSELLGFSVDEDFIDLTHRIGMLAKYKSEHFLIMVKTLVPEMDDDTNLINGIQQIMEDYRYWGQDTGDLEVSLKLIQEQGGRAWLKKGLIDRQEKLADEIAALEKQIAENPVFSRKKQTLGYSKLLKQRTLTHTQSSLELLNDERISLSQWAERELAQIIKDPTYVPVLLTQWAMWPQMKQWANTHLSTGWINAKSAKRTLDRVYRYQAELMDIGDGDGEVREREVQDRIRVVDRNIDSIGYLNQYLNDNVLTHWDIEDLGVDVVRELENKGHLIHIFRGYQINNRVFEMQKAEDLNLDVQFKEQAEFIFQILKRQRGRLREMVDVLTETNYQQTYYRRGVTDPFQKLSQTSYSPPGANALKHSKETAREVLKLVVNERVMPAFLYGGRQSDDIFMMENINAPDKWGQRAAEWAIRVGIGVFNYDGDQRCHYNGVMYMPSHWLEYAYDPTIGIGIPVIHHVMTEGFGKIGQAVPTSENAFYYHGQMGKEQMGGLLAYGKLSERLSAFRWSEGNTKDYVAEDGMTGVKYLTWFYRTVRSAYLIFEKGWPFLMAAIRNPIRKWSYDSYEMIFGLVGLKMLTSAHVPWTMKMNNFRQDGVGFYDKKPQILIYFKWLIVVVLVLSLAPFKGAALAAWIGGIFILAQAISTGLFFYKIYDEGAGVRKGITRSIKTIASVMVVFYMHMIWVYHETVGQLAPRFLGRFIQTESKAANINRDMDWRTIYSRYPQVMKHASFWAFVVAMIVGFHPVIAVLWFMVLILPYCGILAPFYFNEQHSWTDGLTNFGHAFKAGWYGLADNFQTAIYNSGPGASQQLVKRNAAIVNLAKKVGLGKHELVEKNLDLFLKYPNHVNDIYVSPALPIISKVLDLIAVELDKKFVKIENDLRMAYQGLLKEDIEVEEVQKLEKRIQELNAERFGLVKGVYDVMESFQKYQYNSSGNLQTYMNRLNDRKKKIDEQLDNLYQDYYARMMALNERDGRLRDNQKIIDEVASLQKLQKQVEDALQEANEIIQAMPQRKTSLRQGARAAKLLRRADWLITQLQYVPSGDVEKYPGLGFKVLRFFMHNTLLEQVVMWTFFNVILYVLMVKDWTMKGKELVLGTSIHKPIKGYPKAPSPKMLADMDVVNALELDDQTNEFYQQLLQLKPGQQVDRGSLDNLGGISMDGRQLKIKTADGSVPIIINIDPGTGQFEELHHVIFSIRPITVNQLISLLQEDTDKPFENSGQEDSQEKVQKTAIFLGKND